MSKDDPIDIMNGSIDLIKEMFYKKFLLEIFLLYIKMSENTDLTCYKKTRDVMLSKAKDYYKNNKDRLREKARVKNTETCLKRKK